jgi:hypothetical protein
MTPNVESLTAWVRRHPAQVGRAWISSRPRRGVLELDRNVRAGQPQTRVVIRTTGFPDVVVYDRLIAAGGVEIKVGNKYVDARDILTAMVTP